MFSLRKKNCDHTQNYRSNKFVTADGMPMFDFQCFDCDFVDHGYVYGNGEGWDELKIVRDGQIIIYEKP